MAGFRIGHRRIPLNLIPHCIHAYLPTLPTLPGGPLAFEWRLHLVVQYITSEKGHIDLEAGRLTFLSRSAPPKYEDHFFVT